MYLPLPLMEEIDSTHDPGDILKAKKNQQKTQGLGRIHSLDLTIECCSDSVSGLAFV